MSMGRQQSKWTDFKVSIPQLVQWRRGMDVQKCNVFFSLSYIDGWVLHIPLFFISLGSLYVSFPYSPFPSHLYPSLVIFSFLLFPLFSSSMPSPIFLNLLWPRFLYGPLHLVPATTSSVFLCVLPLFPGSLSNDEQYLIPGPTSFLLSHFNPSS